MSMGPQGGLAGPRRKEGVEGGGGKCAEGEPFPMLPSQALVRCKGFSSWNLRAEPCWKGCKAGDAYRTGGIHRNLASFIFSSTFNLRLGKNTEHRLVLNMSSKRNMNKT